VGDKKLDSMVDILPLLPNLPLFPIILFSSFLPQIIKICEYWDFNKKTSKPFGQLIIEPSLFIFETTFDK